jgi:hypothetical protein
VRIKETNDRAGHFSQPGAKCRFVVLRFGHHWPSRSAFSSVKKEARRERIDQVSSRLKLIAKKSGSEIIGQEAHFLNVEGSADGPNVRFAPIAGLSGQGFLCDECMRPASFRGFGGYCSVASQTVVTASFKLSMAARSPRKPQTSPNRSDPCPPRYLGRAAGAAVWGHRVFRPRTGPDGAPACL